MLPAGGQALATHMGIGTILNLVGGRTVLATLLAAGLSSLTDLQTVCLQIRGMMIQRLVRTLRQMVTAATAGEIGQGRLADTVLFLTQLMSWMNLRFSGHLTGVFYPQGRRGLFQDRDVIRLRSSVRPPLLP